MDHGKRGYLRSLEFENHFKKKRDNPVSDTPQHFLSLFQMAKAGEVLGSLIDWCSRVGLEKDPATSIVSGIDQTAERNSDDLFNFPVWEKMLLMDPDDHRVEDAAEHVQVLRGHRAKKAGHQRVESHLLEAFP